MEKKRLAFKSARTLYLNRTCFKGMWRHNSHGVFNVGYWGQDRRWIISKETLLEVSRRMSNVSLKPIDFEKVIDACTKYDFMFADPPYCPGKSELFNDHYTFCKFSYNDHKRLANCLRRATNKGIKWAMTNSSHKKILDLFKTNNTISIPMGTGNEPGLLSYSSSEVLILNYDNYGK